MPLLGAVLHVPELGTLKKLWEQRSITISVPVLHALVVTSPGCPTQHPEVAAAVRSRSPALKPGPCWGPQQLTGCLGSEAACGRLAPAVGAAPSSSQPGVCVLAVN